MITEDEVAKVITLIKEGKSQRQIATSLEQSKSWVARRQAKAVALGLTGPFEGRVPAGFYVTKSTVLWDRETNKPRLEWLHTDKDIEEQEALVNALQGSFEKYTGAAKLLKAPKSTDEDTITIYPISDLHLGLYAWAPEAGESYDVQIAKKRLLETITQLISQAPNSKKAVILELGDFIHCDSDDSRTRKHKNVLDVDTRYNRVLETGVDLGIQAIDLARQKHSEVEVRCLKGNHDPYAAIALTVAFRCFYHNEPRVHIDRDPSYFWQYTHGSVFLSATHGDNIQPGAVAGTMASFYPHEWGATKYRYCYMGHVHHFSQGGEPGGIKWETFNTLAGNSAWEREHGWSPMKSMSAITHHKDRGETQRITVNL